MTRKKQRDEEDESESSGNDLEQMVAMLEKAEIDYDQTTEPEGITALEVNGATMLFDEDGNLTDMEGDNSAS